MPAAAGSSVRRLKQAATVSTGTGATRRPAGAASLLRRNLLIYGLGGLVLPFAGIKVIDMAVAALHLPLEDARADARAEESVKKAERQAAPMQDFDDGGEQVR